MSKRKKKAGKKRSKTARASANPYRPGSMNARVVAVLIRSRGALGLHEIAKRCKLSPGKAGQVLNALRNPFHNARARRAGIAVAAEGNKLVVKKVRADPNAKRPARGEKKGGKKKARTMNVKANANSEGTQP